MPQVAMQRTAYSANQLAPMLQAAMAQYGLNQAGASLLLATILIETANGQAIWNNNVGNITTASDALDWWQPQSGAASALKFRAYATIDEGMADFARYAHSHTKFYAAAQSGNVQTFLERYKADYNPELVVADYIKQFKSTAQQYAPLFASLPKSALVAGAVGLEWLLWAGLAFLFIKRKRIAHG